MRLKGENGYALVIVLALITVVAIMSIPYLNTFLHDTQEIEIENLKNQNIYVLESAVEITRAMVEENNIRSEDELAEIVDLIEANSETLFNESILTSIDMDANKITYETNTSFFNSRADSKISLIYRSFNTNIFESYKIIVSDKVDPGKKISGNNSFMSSFTASDVLGISDELFDELTQEKYTAFQEDFVESGQDHYYDDLILQLTDDLNLNSLWVDGRTSIEGRGSSRPNIIIDQDVYLAGDVDLDKLNKIIINGDLIVYDGDLEIGNTSYVEIGGSLIVNGSIKITGNPVLKLRNISADSIQINSSNSDIFVD